MELLTKDLGKNTYCRLCNILSEEETRTNFELSKNTSTPNEEVIAELQKIMQTSSMQFLKMMSLKNMRKSVVKINL